MCNSILQESNAQDDDPLKKIQGQKIVKCRVCKGDHWTTKCPYKDSLQPLQQKEQDEKGLFLHGLLFQVDFFDKHFQVFEKKSYYSIFLIFTTILQTTIRAENIA